MRSNKALSGFGGSVSSLDDLPMILPMIRTVAANGKSRLLK